MANGDVKLGATGAYPQGKLNETDEGELNLAICRDEGDGRIMIMFGKPVAWLAFSREEAVELASSILKHAGATLITLEFERP